MSFGGHGVQGDPATGFVVVPCETASDQMAAARPSGARVDQAETPFTPAASAAPPALAATSSLAGRAGSAIAALAKGSLSSSPRPGRHQSSDADLEAAYRTMVLLGGRGIV